MTVLDFGQKGCEKIRRYLDSYLSNELLVETNHEVLRHLERCTGCTEELDRKIRARKLLRGAVKAQAPPPALEERVRKAVRARAAAAPGASEWQRWAIAAVVVLGVILGGVKGIRMRQEYVARQAALLAVGLQDHVHCALAGNYPATPPSLAQMAEKMGPGFVQLVPIVEAKLPRYRVLQGHRCSVNGRPYEHIILRGDHGLMSVVVTRKQPGESFPRGVLAPVLNASGIPMHDARLDDLAVSGFETRDFLVFVVSNLSGNANLEVAESLAPRVRGVLGRLES